MSSAQGIRAGKIAVEAGLDDGKFRRGLKGMEKRLRVFGGVVKGLGARMVGLGGILATPFTAGLKSFMSFEDAMASLRANANPTAEELQRINAAVDEIGRATGSGPAEVVNTMTELLKAGMDLQSVLGGAASAALQFARVAEMDAAEAAVVLTDAMNVFGVDATTAVDTISKAADASSISVRDVAMSFSMAGAVAGQAGLSIRDTANAIAVLGQNGVKSSDAGTSLKTMLLRLQTGSESAGVMMRELGINVRTADGRMKDMRGIIGELQMRLAGLSAEARDQAMLKLFGTDAIRAGAILLKEGVAGWDEFNGKIDEGLPVAEKFAILMNTMSGFLQRVWAGVQRLAVALAGSLGGGFGALTDRVVGLIDRVSAWIGQNRELVALVARVAGVLVGAGAALIGLGVAASATGGALGLMGTGIGVLLSPLSLTVGLAVAAGYALWTLSDTARQAFSAIKTVALDAFGGISNALKAGDIALAGRILWLSLQVQWQKGINYLNGLWQDFGVATIDVFHGLSFGLARIMVEIWTGLRAAFVHGSGAITEIFAGAIDSLWVKWTRFAGLIGSSLKAIAALFSTVFVTLGIHRAKEAFASAQGEIEARAAELEAQAQQRIRDREDTRQGQLAAIGMDRTAALASIDDQQSAASAARFAGARESLAAGDAEIARLEGELRAALEEAATKAAPVAEQAAGEAAGKATRLPELSGIGRGMEASERKTDVKGSFSAIALRGLGVGDSLETEQLDESKKQTSLLQSIDNRARQGGLAFE